MAGRLQRGWRSPLTSVMGSRHFAIADTDRWSFLGCGTIDAPDK
jgi:hypothetical protein